MKELNLEEWLQEWHWVIDCGHFIRKVPIDPEVAEIARKHVRYIGINMMATEPRWEAFNADGYVVGSDDGDPNSLIEDLVAKRGNYFAIDRRENDKDMPPKLRTRVQSLLNKIGFPV